MKQKFIAKIKRKKFENFTLNSYILYNFTHNMEQLLESDKDQKIIEKTKKIQRNFL